MKLKVDAWLVAAVLVAQHVPGAEASHIHHEVTAEDHGTRVFEIVFEDDPFVTGQIREDAARLGSIYALRKVEPAPGGGGRVVQDVVLPGP
jgi:hypothetical protein